MGGRKKGEARGSFGGEEWHRRNGLGGKKVALVCDWLTNVGGAEKVLLELHKIFPEAPIYTSQYRPKKIDWFLDAEVRTGWLQIFPAGFRRFLGVFRQRYFEKLDLSGYDLVISVTGAEAKAVKVPDGKHISYCHVPTQYYWQMYDDYVKNPGFGVLNPVVRFFFKLLVKPLRELDLEAAERVDEFITISGYARELILKYYKREAKIICPPVDLSNFSISGIKSQEGKAVEEYYITTSRQVNWKRLDLAVLACLELGRPLVVIGEGPEHKKLVRIAEREGRSLEKVKVLESEESSKEKSFREGEKVGEILFLPVMGKEELAKYLSGARGYIFPSLEPFGIAPVEALAAGCPVIAYGKGGALDYISEGENGVFFKKQTVKALCMAISEFEKKKFSREKVARTAKKFSAKRFDKEILEVLGGLEVSGEEKVSRSEKVPEGDFKK